MENLVLVENDLSDKQVAMAAENTAEAFLDSPLWMEVFQAPENERRELFHKFFPIYFYMYSIVEGAHVFAYCDKETGEVVCSFCLMESDKQPTIFHKLRAGLLRFPLWFGLTRTIRMLRIGGFVDATLDAVVEGLGMKCMILERMVVKNDFQGKGLGAKCLKDALSRFNVPCVLTTQEERNVRFYERLGFKVVDTQTYEDKVKSWTMVRLLDTEEQY